MTELLKSFFRDDSGAVTVDWVVLTAAIVGLGFAVITTVGRGAIDTSTGLGAVLASKEVTRDYREN
ncbi:Flp family type IVb pilin [Boseongicola aestuarii]|uniref:Flp/Fap pilin component n=1 Tax=Boseongicola aestuarii TaxID=1470561 RepID=A0A238IXD8_9RHOB|nr:hypothetical protein [Boseongicola aestuarii]SMX22711.1 hypothetical protein BOA8489_00809 [Boseongicola aestuarii]